MAPASISLYKVPLRLPPDAIGSILTPNQAIIEKSLPWTKYSLSQRACLWVALSHTRTC
jgi:hypothetical protein